MPMKRGFVFTTDAFVALTLISLVVLVIIYQLNIPSALFPQQMQTHDFATDIMVSFTTLKMSDVDTPAPELPYEQGNTVMEQIAKKALSSNVDDRADAEIIAQALLTGGTAPMLPSQFGVSIFVRNPDGTDWEEVIVRGKDSPYVPGEQQAIPYTRVQSS
ncbi:MAG: hypothetical protein WC759_04335, partial [Candidatus Micrarchaeia archaeon]